MYLVTYLFIHFLFIYSETKIIKCFNYFKDLTKTLRFVKMCLHPILSCIVFVVRSRSAQRILNKSDQSFINKHVYKGQLHKDVFIFGEVLW